MDKVSAEVELRKLRYRLQRQGILELDVWFFSLEKALKSQDETIIKQVAMLLNCEVPELLAMHSGQQAIPKELKPWLNM